MHIAIVGAGVSGSYAAHLLGKKFDVTLYEEHLQPGFPRHCTGIFSHSIRKLVKLPDELIQNKISRAVVNTGKSSFEFKVKDIVIDRPALDRFFFEKAKENAKAILKKRIFSVSRENRQFVLNTENSKEKADAVVGADGVSSVVRKDIFKSKNQFYHGLQSVVEGDFDESCYEVFFQRKYSDTHFAWKVPLSKTKALFGTISGSNTSERLNSFLSDQRIKKQSISETFGGAIPMYNSRFRLEKSKAYLLGDAGGLNKAATGGGVIPGIRSAKALYKALSAGRSYNSIARKEVGKELILNKATQIFLKSLSEKQLSGFFSGFLESGIAEKINSKSRDDLETLLPTISLSWLKSPKLLSFSARMISSLAKAHF
ncbi:MAG TPA: NAD(P)/FAD-dependent oxidoreductase [Candidatus Woesearchaeota archaeon]|nr:NAD(P)/FAD-dependent oxidoreductase [Candidatus Woesearchaeota archaeon]